MRRDGVDAAFSEYFAAFFGGGMRVCPGAVPDDGTAQVVVVGPATRMTFLKVFPKVFSGRHLDHPLVTTYRGSKITIDGDPATMWADGDELGPLPDTITVHLDAGYDSAATRDLLTELGCDVRLVPTSHPAVDIVPFQLLTVDVAEARGVDPDVIRRDEEPWARARRAYE
jgi:hypothetical protein